MSYDEEESIEEKSFRASDLDDETFGGDDDLEPLLDDPLEGEADLGGFGDADTEDEM